MSEMLLNVLRRAGNKGYGHITKNGVAVYEARHTDESFKLIHYGTLILEAKRLDGDGRGSEHGSHYAIVQWGGFSNSDRDSLNETLNHLGIDGYFAMRKRELCYYHNETRYDQQMNALDPIVTATAQKALDKRVAEFVGEFKRRIEENDVAVAGECWFIAMNMRPCETCECHIDKECGGGVQFLAKVLREAGYQDMGISIFLNDPQNFSDIIIKALRKYAYKHIKR